jgi:phosphate:Na+ symporter
MAMTGTLTLLNIAGAVATLLWGTHMVTTGVARGFGKELRLLIGTGLKSRISACFAGILATALLQSSTATALMASSFAASGYLDLASGLALMLGANIGTALIVQVIAFNVAAVAPLFILAGFLLFRSSADRAKPRNLGRALIGLGLMLGELTLLVHFLGSIEAVPLFRAAIEALSHEALLAVVVAAVLALAAHSSIAIVLFIVSLASAGIVGGEGALALVLGANLGAAVSPVMEGADRSPDTRDNEDW